MAEREQKRQQQQRSPGRVDDTVIETEETAPDTERGDKLKAELDDLLDEIDEVLEDNAEEFVRNYVQKGGQ
jgi:ubiquitin-like protein Pup